MNNKKTDRRPHTSTHTYANVSYDTAIDLQNETMGFEPSRIFEGNPGTSTHFTACGRRKFPMEVLMLS